MPRVIIYDGTNEEINEFLSSLPTTTYTDASKANERDVTSGNTSKTNSPDANSTDTIDLDKVARDFHARIVQAAAYGRKEQLNTMTRWLQLNGEIASPEIWQAAGVASLHAYAGVGSSLTRNMKGAGGTGKWYGWKWHPTEKGQYIYLINEELLKPLKRAFSID